MKKPPEVSCSFRHATLLKKDSNTGFSCEIWDIFKSNYFEEHLWTTAFELNALTIQFTHNNHVSTVPTKHLPSASAFLTLSQWSNIHLSLTALKYVEIGSPQIF